MDWIKCSDKLPENGQKVITFSRYIDIKYFEQGSSRYIFYDGDTHSYCPVGEIKNVTHWMALPKPPNKHLEELTKLSEDLGLYK